MYFAIRNIVVHLLCAALIVWSGCTLRLLFCGPIATFASLLGAEVDELFAKVDLLLEWIGVESFELLLLALLALGFLLTTALFLPGLLLSLTLLTFSLDALALFIPLLLLLLVPLVALSTLDHHFLGPLDPLNVFDHSLLDLIVAQSAIEGLP